MDEAVREHSDTGATAELQQQFDFVAHDPVINGILQTSSGCVAVLNEQRRVVTVNTTFLSAMGINEPGAVLGLLPGEAIACVHACAPGNECGTTPWCETCGAAIAIVTALADNTTQERKCVADVVRNSVETTICFAVRSCIVEADNRRFVLLFLQDISEDQRRASLERVFFHDLNNIVTALETSTILMHDTSSIDTEAYLNINKRICARLKSEVALQNAFARHFRGDTRKPRFTTTRLSEIVEELHTLLAKHSATFDKRLEIAEPLPEAAVPTVPSLLTRVVMNMVVNAFEATPKGGSIRLGVSHTPDSLRFAVWNEAVIPERIRPRIFQQFFTTKGGIGRGFGTSAMKLVGETILGGEVGFSSAEFEGTEFWISVPAG